jgi:hypothetical protein
MIALSKGSMILRAGMLALVFSLLLGACSNLPSATDAPPTDVSAPAEAPAATQPPPTATSVPPTETPVPTATNTPEPTATNTPEPTPTATPTATVAPITVAQFDALLREFNYTRQTFKGIGQYTDLRPGEIGYIYSGDNWLEPVVVYEDGLVRMQVLNNLDARVADMEEKLVMLDRLFPADFMAELRAAQDAYLATVGRGITGEAAQVWPPPPQDFWSSLEGQYNLSESTIGSYKVAFSLWFWQIECPEGFICWFPAFGDTIFLGQSSFTFYTIEIYIAP